MDLHAASAEQLGDVVLAEERLSDLEASTTSESSMNVTHTDDRIANHVMVTTEHSLSDLGQWHHLARAYLCIIQINTLTKEESMHLLNLSARAEDALVPPKVFQIVTTYPLICSLELVCHSRHEAMFFG